MKPHSHVLGLFAACHRRVERWTFFAKSNTLQEQVLQSFNVSEFSSPWVALATLFEEAWRWSTPMFSALSLIFLGHIRQILL